jgi:hypothetical protein
MLGGAQYSGGASLTQSPVQGGMAQPLPVLPSPGKPVAGVPTSPGNISGQSTWQPPNYISADSTQSAVNNRMGQAHMMGDQRIFQKQFARNGLGSSKGTAYAAQVGQQQALGQGRAEAAGIQAQDQSNNAKARLDFQNGQEREAQALAMVQHALSQAGWSQEFARKQAAAQILAAQQNAQIQMM